MAAPKCSKYDSNGCNIMSTAFNIFNNELNIPLEFMDAAHNKCYCNECHNKRGDETTYFRGKPNTKYILPVGWTRFGLKTDTGKCKMNNVWNDWHVAYHGCSIETAIEIFKSGLHLLKPGDLTINGQQLPINPGHIMDGFQRYNEYTKQQEIFDTNQIFLSPSIKYAALDEYAIPFDARNGLKAKLVFQVRIRPNCYNIGQETIDATKSGYIVDEQFDNNELEWYTKENVGIVVHGLLIKIISNIVPVVNDKNNQENQEKEDGESDQYVDYDQDCDQDHDDQYTDNEHVDYRIDQDDDDNNDIYDNNNDEYDEQIEYEQWEEAMLNEQEQIEHDQYTEEGGYQQRYEEEMQYDENNDYDGYDGYDEYDGYDQGIEDEQEWEEMLMTEQEAIECDHPYDEVIEYEQYNQEMEYQQFIEESEHQQQEDDTEYWEHAL